MHPMGFRNTLCASLLVVASVTAVTGQRPKARTAASIPANILLRIIRAEDQRRWDDNLKSLLTDKDSKVRKRAALAAGRIGDERAVPALIELLKGDADNDVRQMAAFAIGEIESPAGADALIDALNDTKEPGEARARAVEALGKIAAALPEADKDRRRVYGAAILDTLRFEAGRRSRSDTLTILLGLTAVLRAKPERAGSAVVPFLGYSDPRIIADALNTRARLRLKDNNEEVRAVLRHSDPIVRANAARVIGAAEDKGAFEALLDRALHDEDLRVRVSAIRALGALKDERAAQPLTDRGTIVIRSGGERFIKTALRVGLPLPNQNELLELLTSIGNIEAAKGGNTGPYQLSDKPNRPTPRALAIIPEFEKLPLPFFGDAEFHVAAAKISPADYFPSAYLDPSSMFENGVFRNWRYPASIAQGFRTVGTLRADKYGADILNKQAAAQQRLRAMLRESRLPKTAIPDVLAAYIASKPDDAGIVLTEQLEQDDVIIRATAAEILGNQSPNESNTRALIEALPRALRDKDLNDAALAILDALGKQKSAAANQAIKTGLDSSDHLIRRKAVALLKANGVGDFSNRIGYGQTRNTEADYRRAIG